MFAKIVSLIGPVLLAKLLARGEERKYEREIQDLKEQKGVNPLLALGALAIGAVIGGALGFLYSPKTPGRSVNE